MAMLAENSFNSGLLPKDALWWKQTKDGVHVALWRPPQIWPVALQEEPFVPARRFRTCRCLADLCLLCRKPPYIYAAKRRPQSIRDFIYKAPLYNVYEAGNSCTGTHRYPQDINQVPESFFTAFFTKAAVSGNRSQKYPDDLLKLWEEIDSKRKYPMDDLVRIGTIGDLLR